MTELFTLVSPGGMSPPGGTILPPGKWDSLERAWRKDRIMMRHDNKDDAQGMVHLERLTEFIWMGGHLTLP